MLKNLSPVLSGSYLPSGHRLHTLSELSCLNFPAGQGKQPRKLSAVLTGPHGVSAVGGLNFPASHKLICPYPAFEIVFEKKPGVFRRRISAAEIAGKSRENRGKAPRKCVTGKPQQKKHRRSRQMCCGKSTVETFQKRRTTGIRRSVVKRVKCVRREKRGQSQKCIAEVHHSMDRAEKHSRKAFVRTQKNRRLMLDLRECGMRCEIACACVRAPQCFLSHEKFDCMHCMSTPCLLFVLIVHTLRT